MARGDEFSVVYVDGDVPQRPIQPGQLLVDSSKVSPGVTSLLQCTAQTDPATYEPVMGGYPAVPEESGVTIVNYNYPPGDFRRYGAVGDDATNDSAAISAACSTGLRMLGGGSQYTYRLGSAIALTKSFDLDLQGATIKPDGNHLGFFRNTGNAWAAQTTVSSGATIGSRSFVVASATGIVVGQWCRVQGNDEPTNDSLVFPSHWSKVTSVSGTTIEIDSPFRITQQGTITAEFYNTSSIYSLFKCYNGIFDGSASTYNSATGQAIRIFWFENVDIDCEFVNWTNNGTLTNPLEVAQCVDVRVRVRVVDFLSKFHVVDIQESRTAHLRDSVCIGGGFGMTISRCEDALMIGNSLQGRYEMEQDGDLSSTSVRGLKMYGCGSARMLGNDISDYESPIKVECCHQYDVSHNSLRNGGLATYTGQVSLNVSNQVDGDITKNGRVCDNLVINSGGVAIAVSNGLTESDDGRCIISGNQVKGCQTIGIHCSAPNSIITDNRIDDWNLLGSTYTAITYNDGATVSNNRFRHSSDTTSICLNQDFASGCKYVFRDNVVESANPLFDTGGTALLVDNKGSATITSGTTTKVVTHLMVRTPEVTDIVLTPSASATNDYGNVWVDNITPTQFTINVRSDPGASGVTIGWRVALRMPYTA